MLLAPQPPLLAGHSSESTRFVRVAVQDPEGTRLAGADVPLLGGGSDAKGTTGLPGRVAFRLSGSGTLFIRVSRPGYAAALQEVGPIDNQRVKEFVVTLVPLQSATPLSCGGVLGTSPFSNVPPIFAQAGNTITP